MGTANVNNVPDNVRWSRVAAFVALTFALDWGLAGAAYAAGVRWGGVRAVALGTLFMLGPFLSAFILQAWVYREDALETLGIKPVFNHVMPLAVVGPLLLTVLATVVALLLPGVEFSADTSGLIERMGQSLSAEQVAALKEKLEGVSTARMFLVGLLQALAAGCTVNALICMGEEAGWRGFLQRELSPLGFWKSSFLVGAVWGIWHAPLIIQGHNYPQHPEIGVGLMVVFCMLLAPLLAFLRITALTTWAPAVAHGVVNGSAGLALVMLKGGDDLTVGVTGLPGLLILVAFNVLLFRLGAPSSTPWPAPQPTPPR